MNSIRLYNIIQQHLYTVEDLHDDKILNLFKNGNTYKLEQIYYKAGMSELAESKPEIIDIESMELEGDLRIENVNTNDFKGLNFVQPLIYYLGIAVKNGKLLILKWFYNHYKMVSTGCGNKPLPGPAGQSKIISHHLMSSVAITNIRLTEIMNIAAENGHLHILEWGESLGWIKDSSSQLLNLPWLPNIRGMNMALKNNHQHVLNWSKGVPMRFKIKRFKNRMKVSEWGNSNKFFILTAKPLKPFLV